MSNNQLPADVQERIKADAAKLYPLIGDIKKKIGYIAGATAEVERAQIEIGQLKLELKQKTKALERFMSMHETGLLPNRFVYDNAKEILEQWKEGKEVDPVKEIEYMPIHPDDSSKFDCPTQFPMHLLNEEQAQKNHGQSLKRLKERGGLGVNEILAIVYKKNWSHYRDLQWKEAIGMLNDILTNPPK